MLRLEKRFRFAAGAGPVAVLLAVMTCALAPAAGASAFPDPAATEPAAGVPTASAPPASQAGREIAERYEIEVLSDAVLLRPKQADTAVRTIELSEDGEVFVNGKEFDGDELAGFLGEDGRRLAELSELDFDELRTALGVAVPAEEPAAVEAEGGTPDIDIDLHGIPGAPRVRVHHGQDDRVSVGKSIHVLPGETANEVVCVGCSVRVEGHATGNVVAVGGGVDVRGTIDGDAVSIGGGVEVADGAEVGGEAVSVGAGVDVAEGGTVHGQRSSIGLGGPFVGGFGDGWGFPFGVFSDVGRLLAAILRTGVLVLLGVLALMLLRPAVERASVRVSEEPWKAVLAGLLLQLFFLPVLVLVIVVLAVSIIGIPLLALVPVALLALLVSALIGFVAVAQKVGRWAERRTGGRFTSAILVVVVGIVLIQAVSLFGRLISLPGGWLAVIGFTIVGLGFVLKYAAWTVGMGAMTLVLFGRDWRRPLPSKPAEIDEEEAPAPPSEPAAVLPPPPPQAE